MDQPSIRYDELGDTLYISFAAGEDATGIELSDHILLRLDLRARRPIGLTLLDYSILSEQTEIGPRSFPLTGLRALSPELRETVLAVLLAEPLRSILTVSAYTPTASVEDVTPIAWVHSVALRPRAA